MGPGQTFCVEKRRGNQTQNKLLGRRRMYNCISEWKALTWSLIAFGDDSESKVYRFILDHFRRWFGIKGFSKWRGWFFEVISGLSRAEVGSICRPFWGFMADILCKEHENWKNTKTEWARHLPRGAFLSPLAYFGTSTADFWIRRVSKMAPKSTRCLQKSTL